MQSVLQSLYHLVEHIRPCAMLSVFPTVRTAERAFKEDILLDGILCQARSLPIHYVDERPFERMAVMGNEKVK